MREHEVPTHVQTEDKVLLWFTFPQIAAMLAAGGLAYGLWRFLPIGSDEVRLGLAAAVALIGVTAAMGKIGGRRLPMVAADLLRFHLTPRRYEGPPSELARTQSPAPVEKRPSQLTAFARRMKASAAAVRRRRPLRGDRKRKTKGQRRPFRPHARFGKGRGTHAAVLAAAALAAIAVMAAHPQRSAADGPPTDEDLDWLDGVEFRPPEPIPGRRVFVEELKVANGRATVGLRAATDLDLHVRAFGGPQGNRILFSDSADLQQAERVQYVMPLDGPRPSLEFSWQDSRAQAGTLALDDDRLPHPLPSARGRLCSLALKSVRWTPGKIHGVVSSRCAATIQETVPRFCCVSVFRHRPRTDIRHD